MMHKVTNSLFVRNTEEYCLILITFVMPTVLQLQTNCANEQDWQDPNPPSFKRRTIFTPALVPTGKKMYVPCLNKEVEMELTGEGTSYWWSKDRAYVLWDGVWNYATGNGNQVKELTCNQAPPPPPVVTNTVTERVIYVESFVQTMNALYEQQPCINAIKLLKGITLV